MPVRSTQRILVVGGSGFYGRYVVRDLLATTKADIVVAGRRPATSFEGGRTSVRVADLRRVELLRDAAHDVDLVIHCAGPFTDLPLAPLDVAIELGIPYVDIAEDRAFVRAVRDRHEAAIAAGIPVLTGSSVSSAMEALAVRYLRGAFKDLVRLRTYAAPDTKHHRGPAMFATMLTGAGRPFEHPTANHGGDASGWTEPEWIELPEPVGRRLTYRIHDVADLDLIPEMFGIEDVAFKAGSEWPILNALVGLAAQIRIRTGHPDWRRATVPARALSRLAGRFGRPEGGVAFELTGRRAGDVAMRSLAIVSATDGGAIPSLLATMAADVLLSGRFTRAGVAEVGGWIDPADWLAGLARRGLSIWERSDRREAWRRTTH